MSLCSSSKRYIANAFITANAHTHADTTHSLRRTHTHTQTQRIHYDLRTHTRRHNAFITAHAHTHADTTHSLRLTHTHTKTQRIHYGSRTHTRRYKGRINLSFSFSKKSVLATNMSPNSYFTYDARSKKKYKVVQILPGLFVCKQFTVCPGHI